MWLSFLKYLYKYKFDVLALYLFFFFSFYDTSEENINFLPDSTFVWQL